VKISHTSFALQKRGEADVSAALEKEDVLFYGKYNVPALE